MSGNRTATNRLNSTERRDMIVSAAVPLFARKGFAGTTTREIAEAAGVSEGLLFKYFANKTALYDAIVHQFRGQNPTFEEIRDLVPSTASLVQLVSVTTERFLTLADGNELLRGRYSLFLRSLCEDGAFARVGVEAYSNSLRAVFKDYFEAARRSGDVVDEAPDATRAFWIMSQQQFLMAAWGLAAERVSPLLTVEDNVCAILRSIGLTESAIRRLVQPEATPRSGREPAARIAS